MRAWNILFTGVLMMSSFFIGSVKMIHYYEAEAIKAGVAEYSVNPHSGKVRFVYKTLVKQDSKTNE